MEEADKIEKIKKSNGTKKGAGKKRISGWENC